jgi:hypothetical protein
MGSSCGCWICVKTLGISISTQTGNCRVFSEGMAGLFGGKNRTAGLVGGEADRAVFIIADGISKSVLKEQVL